MIPRCAEQIEDGGFHRERAAEKMDEFARVFADDFGTEDTAALRLGDDLHVAVVRVHENGFAVVVERIARDEVGRAGCVEFAFKAADGGEWRVGEDDGEEERPIDGFDFFHAGGVAGGEFALLDGDVDDFDGAGAITARVDVRHVRLLPAVRDDLAVGAGADAGGGEIEGGGIRLAAEGVEQVRGAAGDFFPVVEKLDSDAATVGRDTLELRAGEEFDPFINEGLLNHGRRSRGVVAQEVGAALHQSDATADATEELGEFAGDDAAAEDDHALGDEIEIEDVVAGPEF